ncbi:CUB domain-containing protein 1 [Octodon degus]|uniref:CUB domain-containing protein 1 n=1 Tax=Octodon degus TaxID=10160 RepID=A0A6P3FMS1_OCTDE|nr:CUB domain-containing protein 1 [Octodon degus]
MLLIFFLIREFLLFLPVFTAGGQGGDTEITVPQGSGVTVLIKPGTPALAPRPCHLLLAKRPLSVLLVKPGERTGFTFTCRDPEKHFVLEIQKNIDCTSGPCPLGDIPLQPPAAALPTLNKTFVWDVRARKSAGLELRFSGPRLRQIGPGDRCPDGVTHTVSGLVGTTIVKIGTFCGNNGTVSRIKLQEGVKVALHLPWLQHRNTSGFSIVNHTAIKRLCIIESVFEGEGFATLMSANYPAGFPEDELMTWQFVVPAPLRASVSFLDFNVSNCERKEERVEYYIPGSATNPEVFRLDDPQPGNMAGNFNLSLQGCDQDAQSPGALRLRFHVLVQHPQTESNKTYVVDLSQERTLFLTIEPRPRLSRRFVAGCFVCLESRTCSPSVTLAPGSRHKISFLCDDLTRLWAVAEKTLSCTDYHYCQRRSFPLLVPGDILRLPVQLRDFSWKLLMPKDRLSLALTPVQKLQQHTHERPCNASFSYVVASAGPGHDLYFGSFCAGGSIEQVLVRQNSSVTLRTFAPSFQSEVPRQGLTVSFLPYFKEEGIFTVTPDTKSKVYLRTPNWDRGLPALSSVSWNISVPSGQEACLTFSKERTGVVCQSGRAFMIIQAQRTRAEEIFSLEDDTLPKPSFHHHSFWVNISNCSPAHGKQLDLLFWVTLSPRTLDLTAIIAAVVGGGVSLLFALGLIICCVKKKKKKGNKGPAVGVYNGNINTQMPLQPKKFQKGRRDNDSHVYAVIEDTMVYGHLLQDSGGSFLQPEVDTYRPFQGATGKCPPSPPPMCSRAPTTKLASEEPPPCFSPEPESEPYTFSHPGPVAGSHRSTQVPLLDSQEPGPPTE